MFQRLALSPMLGTVSSFLKVNSQPQEQCVLLFYPQGEVTENGPMTMAAEIFCHVNVVKKFLESVTQELTGSLFI